MEPSVGVHTFLFEYIGFRISTGNDALTSWSGAYCGQKQKAFEVSLVSGASEMIMMMIIMMVMIVSSSNHVIVNAQKV